MLTSPGFSPEVRQAQQRGWGQDASKSGPPSMTTDTLQDIPNEVGTINVQGTQMGDNNFGVNLSLTPTNNYYSPSFGGSDVNVDALVVGGEPGPGTGSLISQFNARITSSSSLATGRWTYAIEEVDLTSGTPTATGNTFSGVLNELEYGNSSSLQSGYSISGGFVVLSGGVTQLQIAAVPAGTVVIASVMQDSYGSEFTVFSQQNPFTGTMGGGSPFFYAKITGNTATGTGTGKWTYDYTQMTLTTSGTYTTTATTGTATNDYEEANTTTSHAGLELGSGYRLRDFPGYQLQPVPNDRIVMMGVTAYTNGTGGTSYKTTFSSPNPVKNSAFPNNWFWAKITSNSAIAGASGRWTYGFTEQVAATGVSTTTLTFSNGANTGTAFNEWEAGNTSALQGGYPIAGGYIDNATGYNIAAIPVNSIVRMRVEQIATGDGGTPYNLRYMFNAPNPVIGSCQ